MRSFQNNQMKHNPLSFVISGWEAYDAKVLYSLITE